MCASMRWPSVWVMLTFATTSTVSSTSLRDGCSSVTAASALFPTPSTPQCALSPRVHDHDENRAWEVKLTQGKGRGMFATRDIAKGTHVLVEHPLLSIQLPELLPGKGYDMAAMVHDVTRQYLLLDAQDKEEFDSCHEHRFEGDSHDEAGRLMAILRSNGYTTQGADGATRVAMYPKVALINHSCWPNVLNVDTEVKRIIAVRDILAGEEILTTYIPLLMDTASRNHRLHQYGFECGCEACTSKTSDHQRAMAGDDLQELEQAVLQPSSAARDAELLRKAELVARYVEDQAFADYDVKTTRLAYEFALRAGDSSRARVWAEKHVDSLRLIDPSSTETQIAEQMVNEVS